MITYPFYLKNVGMQLFPFSPFIGVYQAILRSLVIILNLIFVYIIIKRYQIVLFLEKWKGLQH